VPKAIRIAIDGPASSGKGTVARSVAQELGCAYVDSGAMFRAVALWAEETNVPCDDGAALAEMIEALCFDFSWGDGSFRIHVNGRDVSDDIRTERVGTKASDVAVLPAVREALLGRQRELGRGIALVMDGRDIGTVVLPSAEVKVFLDASVEVRAERRFQELRSRGLPATLKGVLKEVSARDTQDSTRASAPLRRASDAVYIDTSGMTAEEAVRIIVELAKSKA
jgi:cytidylate kinase